MKNKESVKNINSEKIRKIIFGCLGLFIVILFIAYLCISQYYKDHFYAQTFINGTDCSNLTAEEAQEKITTDVNTYVLNIVERNDVTEQISAADIGLTCTFDQDITEVLDDQSAYSWLVNSLKDNKVDNPYTLSFDEDKLNDVIESLECLQSENQVEPTNATISEYSEETGFTIVPEEQGSTVVKDTLVQAITEAINNLNTEISLEDSDCYEKPEVTSDDPILSTTMDTIDKYMQTKLTYTFGDNTEVFDSTYVGPAITVDEDYNVGIDESKVKEFVDYIGKTYNTIFTTRTFMTSYGKEVTLDQGDYGWWLNRDDELDEIIECIKNGEQKDKEPVYYQVAAQFGDTDIGGTYVEINLSAQHLFAYKDGELVLESDFVSGKVSNGCATPTGVYPIQFKKKDATLTGETYSTPVDYWMPFNKNIGLHDATWRSSSEFGGDTFINNGSHGCINLPHDVAEQLYDIVEQYTTAVICYELEGTESYDVSEYNTALEKAKAYE